MLLSTLATLVLLASTFSPLAAALPSPDKTSSYPEGLVDLGYARHIPTSINETESGRKIAIYKNIRFARPPVGDLRFRKPDPRVSEQDGVQTGDLPWEETSCIATVPSYLPLPGNGTTLGHEDCLFLDVYVPVDLKPHDKVPVLHLFHGSAYAFLNKDLYSSPMGLFNATGDDGNFIYVANNYR